MKYFIALIISLFVFIAESSALRSEFYNLGTFTVNEKVTPKYAIKHKIYFARTEGKQYSFRIKNRDNIVDNATSDFNSENQYTTVVVNPKQIYQLYHSGIKANYYAQKFFIRFKKYLFFTYGANEGGTVGLAIKPGKLRTIILFILNSQEYEVSRSDFTHFMRIIKPVAEDFGPISVLHESPILGHLK